MHECLNGPVVTSFQYFHENKLVASGRIRMSGRVFVDYVDPMSEEGLVPIDDEVVINAHRIKEFNSYNLFRQTYPYDPHTDMWIEVTDPKTDVDGFFYAISRMPYFDSDKEKFFSLELPVGDAS